MDISINLSLVVAGLFSLLLTIVGWLAKLAHSSIRKEVAQCQAEIKAVRKEAADSLSALRQTEIREIYQLIRDESKSTQAQVQMVLTRVIDMQDQMHKAAAATTQAVAQIQMMGRRAE